MGRSRSNRRIAAAKAKVAPKPRGMASFREDAGENRALQIQNGADAGKFPPLPSQKSTGNQPQQKQEPTVPPRPPIPRRDLRYPRNEQIHNTTDYLKIEIVEYEPIGDKLVGDPGSRRTNGKKILHSIILPIPPNIQDGNAVSYSDSSLNGLTAALAGGTADVMKGLPQVLAGKMEGGDLKNKIEGRINQSGLDLSGVQDLLTKKLSASAASVFGGNVSLNQLQSREEGKIFNPNMELLFNGPTLRSFRFSFKMTPRSKEEAVEVRDIINTFKRSMAPKTVTSGSAGSQNLFLKTPDIFELKYMQGSKDHSFLHQFKQCFLENMSVNYTAEGTYATYEDGTPISLVMNLSFKELEPIYDIDYHDEVSTGVGF